MADNKHIIQLALWGGAAVLGGLLLGVLVKPRLFYDQFIWKYFWGPIVADSTTGTAMYNGIVAHKGYTLVNEIGYGLILVYLLLLLITVFDRFDIGREPGFLLYFVPFVIGGGMLRVVEDVAAQQPGMLGAPLTYFLISPLIYFTMFGIVFLTLLLGIYLQRNSVVSDYKQVVIGGGTIFAVSVLGFLLHTLPVERPVIAVQVLGLAGVLLGGVILGGKYISFAGRLLGTKEGWTVLFGHLLDGSSTAVSIEELGYGEKHPVAQAIIDTFGTAYAFLLVKLLVIGGILYYIRTEDREDDPLFVNLVLLAIFAVGMGPGVRNLTRAIFGV